MGLAALGLAVAGGAWFGATATERIDWRPDRDEEHVSRVCMRRAVERGRTWRSARGGRSAAARSRGEI